MGYVDIEFEVDEDLLSSFTELCEDYGLTREYVIVEFIENIVKCGKVYNVFSCDDKYSY